MGSDIAVLLNKVLGAADRNAKAANEKFETHRQADVAMYTNAMKQLDITDPKYNEKRTEYAKKLDQLNNMKGKEGHYSRLAGLLNKISEAHHAGKQDQTDSTPTKGPAGNSSPGAAPPSVMGEGGTKGLPPLNAPPSDPNVNPVQKGLAMKALHKVGKGLATTMSVGSSIAGGLLNPPGPPSLTSLDPNPLDTGVFPSAQQEAKNKGEQARIGAEAGHVNSLEQAKNDLHQAFPDLTPEQVEQATMQKGGFAAKPKWAKTYMSGPQGDGYYLTDENDKSAAPVFIGKKPEPVGSETTNWPAAYDPTTGKSLPSVTTRRPLKAGSSADGKQLPGQPTGQGSKKGLTPLTGASQGASQASGQGKGASGAGDRSKAIPYRQFGQLQKQANAINEARNSLIGDDPQKVGGMAADLDVFNNPESVKKLGEYIGFMNQQLDKPAKDVTGEGWWAATEWYAGLPTTVNSLQQEAMRQIGKPLNEEEKKFIADYYRLIGTVGGLRAATGASSARWSFQNLRGEVPTPGPVTTYSDAKNRLKNLLKETNVVAQNNSMVQKVDTDRLDKLGANPYR